ncbi:MAG: hypothetical protein HOK41_16890 [Nitrospina sp.]|jgi:hypothetical protein|nr:hypothetical protein [Nitrospina sp.]MBT6716430.1 hypothetical protein [Nitrospina sp.]
MQKLRPQQLFRLKLFLVFLSLFIHSCATLDPFKQSQEELDLKIKAFNFEFESKAMERSSRFVHPDYREEFQKKSLQIVKNVSILEASTLDLILLKDNKPVPSTSSIFEQDFDKAELNVRYQLSVLPSTKVKTMIVKQEWVRVNGIWFLIPNLDPFLN